jgi:hypothetical protein
VVQIVLYGSFHCTTELGRRLIARKEKGEVLAITTTYAATGSAFVVPVREVVRVPVDEEGREIQAQPA